MRKTLLTAIFMLVLSIMIYPDISSASFEDVGWGARPTGMGGAFSALADDSNSVLWNPAGISKLERSELNFMYAKLFSGLDDVNLGLNYFGFAHPFGRAGTLGINWANFTSTSQYREDSFVLSYANKLFSSKEWMEEMAFGINLKYLGFKYTLDSYAEGDPVFTEHGSSKYAFSVDAGIQITPVDNFSVGFAAMNLNNPDVGLGQKEPLPREAKIGLGLKFSDKTQVGFDISYLPEDLNFHLGLENWMANKTFALRLGGNLKEVAMGIGLSPEVNKTFGLQFDYSFIWPLEVKSTYGTHRLSFLAKFGKTKATKEQEKKERLAEEERKRRDREEKARALAEVQRAKREAEEARKKAQEAEEAARKARESEEVARRKAEEAAALARKKAEEERQALIAEALKAKLQVKEEGKDVIITLHINFPFGKFEIKGIEKTKLNQVVEILNTFSDYNIRIEGHTDSVGSEEYNLKLSEQRSYNVALYLSGQGVDSDRISYVGYGETRPVADNKAEEGRSLNRRVEFVVLTSE